jgi:hypothetical protein
VSLAPAELAALRSSADQGMFEQAAPAHAEAREKLLQLYRDAWLEHAHLQLADPAPRSRPMGDGDLPGVQWIARLAAAGHAPAGAFLERVLRPPHVQGLLEAAPQAVEELALAVPSLARFLAWEELRKEAPQRPRLERWLEAGGEECRGVLEGLRELDAIAGGPNESDWTILRHGLPGEHAPGNFEDTLDLGVEGVLYLLAQNRLPLPDEASQRAARALLERAAQLGSAKAAEHLFVEDFKAAPKKRAFLEQWFARGLPRVASSRRPCLQLGAALERGVAGGAPDLRAARAWYRRAVGDYTHEPEFCYRVAIAFDRRWRSSCMVDDAEMAMRWHERALVLGDERCCDAWLEACAKGDMGLAADPAAALERVRRYRDSGADLKARRWRTLGAVRALHAAAAAESDAARAAKWREAAAVLEKD